MKLFNYISILVICLFSVSVYSQYKSPFNQNEIQTEGTQYSFIVSGHFYGDGGNKSRFPVNTLLANLDWINGSNAVMLVCLGDLFKDVSNDIPNYQTSLFDKLEMPLVNAVGNHDLTDNIYQDNFGKTAFSFQINQDVHIVLDTERDNGDITGEQLDLLKDAKTKVNNGVIQNVFIYTHRTIWKEAYSEMDGIFEDNTQSIGGTNYESEVLPILKEMGEKVHVYLFSGSLGTAPASFFHFYDKENNVKIIATAIRGLPRDAMLEVMVNEMGEASFTTKSLTGEKLDPLNYYDVEYWQTEVGTEPFNWKMIPYYIELMLKHRFFWYGVGLTSLGFFILIWFAKRRNQSRYRV
ncbi:MAG: hypothetical protein GQ574_09220 [Crocinitomix sp.]|nr:hypothetical protein [Crocinitomix sp.]